MLSSFNVKKSLKHETEHIDIPAAMLFPHLSSAFLSLTEMFSGWSLLSFIVLLLANLPDAQQCC